MISTTSPVRKGWYKISQIFLRSLEDTNHGTAAIRCHRHHFEGVNIPDGQLMDNLQGDLLASSPMLQCHSGETPLLHKELRCLIRNVDVKLALPINGGLVKIDAVGPPYCQGKDEA